MDPPVPFAAQAPPPAAGPTEHAFQAWAQMIAQYPDELSRHFVEWTAIQRLERMIIALQTERAASQQDLSRAQLEVQRLQQSLSRAQHEVQRLQQELQTRQSDLDAARAQIPDASKQITISRVTRVEDPQHPPKPLALLGDRRRRDILLSVHKSVQKFISQGVSPVYALQLRSLVLDCMVDGQPVHLPFVTVSNLTHPNGTILSENQRKKFVAQYLDQGEDRGMAAGACVERVPQEVPVCAATEHLAEAASLQSDGAGLCQHR